MLNHAYINLKTLRENAVNVKAKLSENTKFCAVVKANAYGHGLVEVANALYGICDSFAVALKEEALTLRLAGIKKDILMLIPPFESDIKSLIENNITLTAGSLDDVIRFGKTARALGKRAKFHVAFNSGMNRFGVNLKELADITDYAKHDESVKLDGMFSHLACPEKDKRLKSAIDKFLLANKLVKGYNNKATCHVSASGGFLRGLDFDMVRIGLLLYGYKPFKSDYVQVKPVMSVYAPVVLKRKVSRGERLLYGTYKLKKSQRVSIVRFGYADGLPRKSVKGQLNNRCMDVSAVSEKAVNGKRYFEIMTDADVLAKKYGTVSYEILTSVAVRAQKIYIN